MHQRIQANNRAALVEAARNRAEAFTVQQDHVKRDLRQQLAQTQHMVMDLQHEVHYLNNQLHPILDEDEDDAISDLDGEHAEE